MKYIEREHTKVSFGVLHFDSYIDDILGFKMAPHENRPCHKQVLSKG